MLIYYDKIFKDTAEHKIDYSTPNVMRLIDVTKPDEEISPISLVHIANDSAGKAVLRT